MEAKTNARFDRKGMLQRDWFRSQARSYYLVCGRLLDSRPNHHFSDCFSGFRCRRKCLGSEWKAPGRSFDKAIGSGRSMASVEQLRQLGINVQCHRS